MAAACGCRRAAKVVASACAPVYMFSRGATRSLSRVSHFGGRSRATKRAIAGTERRMPSATTQSPSAPAAEHADNAVLPSFPEDEGNHSWTWVEPVAEGVRTHRLPEHTARAEEWTWSSNVPRRPGRGEPEIEVKRGVPLSVGEVVAALERQGATDVRVVPLAHKTDFLDAMVFCTGRTPQHMRSLADIVVRALKERRLRRAPGVTGAEGYDDDQWMLVDCENIVVHVFEADYRRELALERHWTNMRPLEFGGRGGLVSDDWDSRRQKRRDAAGRAGGGGSGIADSDDGGDEYSDEDWDEDYGDDGFDEEFTEKGSAGSSSAGSSSAGGSSGGDGSGEDMRLEKKKRKDGPSDAATFAAAAEAVAARGEQSAAPTGAAK